MKKLILLFLIILPQMASSYEDGFALKGGGSFSHYGIRSQGHSQNSSNGGFNTHVGLRIFPFELNVSSYIFFGSMKDYSLFGNTSKFTFFAGNQEIETSGKIRNVIFSPTVKYISNYTINSKWHLYFGFGPMWSLTTMNLSPYTDQNNTLKSDDKITFTNFGGVLFVGLEELLGHKSEHPVYVELLYAFAKTRRMRIVDASDKTEVQEITVEEVDFDVFGHTLMLNFGLTVF